MPRVALVWSQFGPYHVDRCRAAAAMLEGKAELTCVEMASATDTYLWAPSGAIAGVRKVTLFPGRKRESLGFFARWWAQAKVLWRHDLVFIGVPYSRSDVIALTWSLRLLGVRFVAMTDSKFDDMERRLPLEVVKAALLLVYSGALVAGARQYAYMRMIGFRRRPVVPGYDMVSVERVRREAAAAARGLPDVPFDKRPFLFVGRLVAKKNLSVLLRAYARYRALAGAAARPLVLAGSGEEEAALRAEAASLGIGGAVEMPGFLSSADVAGWMHRALALVLPSREEQWGLVVNEAVAVGLPIIASRNVGAGDLLVRSCVNGHVFDAHDVEALAAAMHDMGRDETRWRTMAAASNEVARWGDTERFAAAVLHMIDPDDADARLDNVNLRMQLGLL